MYVCSVFEVVSQAGGPHQARMLLIIEGKRFWAGALVAANGKTRQKHASERCWETDECVGSVVIQLGLPRPTGPCRSRGPPSLDAAGGEGGQGPVDDPVLEIRSLITVACESRDLRKRGWW